MYDRVLHPGPARCDSTFRTYSPLQRPDELEAAIGPGPGDASARPVRDNRDVGQPPGLVECISVTWSVASDARAGDRPAVAIDDPTP